jgi:hypothetical protein
MPYGLSAVPEPVAKPAVSNTSLASANSGLISDARPAQSPSISTENGTNAEPL